MYLIQTALWAGFRADIGAVFRAKKSIECLPGLLHGRRWRHHRGGGALTDSKEFNAAAEAGFLNFSQNRKT